jgi:tetratricopeptide (TPR) repeat protein
MYKVFICLVSILPVLALAQDPEQLLMQANQRMGSGELDKADSLLKESLKVDPSFAPAHIGFSELWLRKGDLNKANASATRAVQMDEEFRPWWNGLNDIRTKIQNGKRNVQQGQFDIAMQNYQSIADKYPYFPETQFYMGLTKFREKDIEGAAYYFSEALKIYPDHMKARKGLNNVTKQFLNNGNKAYKRGNLDKATDYYQKAIKYDVDFYLAFYQLGVLEQKIGNSKEAILYFNKAIMIKPDFYKAWFTLGTSYEVNNNLDSAIVKYEKAIEINPVYTKAYSNLGNIRLIRKEYEEAKRILLTAIQIDSTYSDAYLRLGVIYTEQELFTEASEQFKKSTEYDDKNYDTWFRYASSLNAVDRFKEASISAQNCIDLKSNFGGGWYEKGVAEFKSGKKTRALKYFEEANKDRDWRKLAQRKIDEINNPTRYQK